MILVDVNLLIYATDADSVHHKIARRWLEEQLSTNTWVGLAWIVLVAFLRITTCAGIMRKPLSAPQAVEFIDGWLAQPYATIIVPGERHWAILKNLLLSGGTAGNLTTDAHLAAMAIEHGCELASADNDFRRFSGIRVVNPLMKD